MCICVYIYIYIYTIHKPYKQKQFGDSPARVSRSAGGARRPGGVSPLRDIVGYDLVKTNKQTDKHDHTNKTIKQMLATSS